MRQATKNTSESGNGPKGRFPKEGMREGPAKGAKFSEQEIAYLQRRYAELILAGKTDYAIAGFLAGEMKRPVGSMCGKIRSLVKNGELGKNPNKQSEFSEGEIKYIEKRRAELILKGKNDEQIGGVLAAEMKRSAGGMREKIRRLAEDGGFEENPNKQNGLGEKEVAKMKVRRAGLILEGKNDARISGILAEEIGRPAHSIRYQIIKLVESGGLGENPNNRRDFSEEEVACLKKRRVDLIPEGKNDAQIARVLAGEMDRSVGSIKQKIHKLVKIGELEGNPNKLGREFSEVELALQLSAAVDMYLGDSP